MKKLLKLFVFLIALSSATGFCYVAYQNDDVKAIVNKFIESITNSQSAKQIEQLKKI